MTEMKALECNVALMKSLKGFSECFFMPEETLAQTLETLLESFEAACPSARKHIEKMVESLKNDGLHRLQVDFSALFIGPYQLLAPPFGSVYIEKSRQVMGESTMDVLRLYSAGGMEVVGDFNQPPDHIAAEMEFMAHLLYRQIEAFQIGDEEALENYRSICKEFMENHVNWWWLPFAQDVGREAKTGFYKALAGCLESTTKALLTFTPM